MTEASKTLPTVAEKAAELVKKFIEHDLGGNVGSGVLVEVGIPIGSEATRRANARDSKGEPCIVLISEFDEDDAW